MAMTLKCIWKNKYDKRIDEKEKWKTLKILLQSNKLHVLFLYKLLK